MGGFFSSFFGSGPDVDGAQARDLVHKGARLVDVRSEQEFASGHIQGAVNIPLHLLKTEVARLRKDKPVVVYCLSGSRSASAKRFLQSQGFERVHDLGSIGNW